jgi:hypothetical protein
MHLNIQGRTQNESHHALTKTIDHMPATTHNLSQNVLTKPSYASEDKNVSQPLLT